MLEEAGPLLGHGWVTGDDEMGRSSQFRAELRRLDERYLLAVPSNTTVRDPDGAVPERGGRGGPRSVPSSKSRAWAGSLPRGRGGGSRWASARVARSPWNWSRRGWWRGRTGSDRAGGAAAPVVIRGRDEGGATRHDYYLSSAAPETLPGVLARAAEAEHRVERWLLRGQGEAGLAESQVRTRSGWHHHQALSLIVAWFLVQEARRGEKVAPAPTVPQVRAGLTSLLRVACGCDDPGRVAGNRRRWLTRTALARLYHWKKCKRLAPLRKCLRS